MNKWIKENWSFRLEVIDGYVKDCRLGLEKGDVFSFEYETPQGFCPRAISEIYTYCEIIRCGGNFTYRGSKEKYSIDVSCPCNCIRFRLLAVPKEELCYFVAQSHKKSDCILQSLFSVIFALRRVVLLCSDIRLRRVIFALRVSARI